MTDRSFEQKNAETRARLARLVANLTPAQLEVDLGGGWNVASALAHMGMWDRWQGARLRDSLDGRGLAMLDDIVEAEHLANVAIDPYVARIQASPDLGRIALEAAIELDAIVASLPDERVEAILASPNAYLVNRFRHRGEHLDQIERGLAAV